MISEQTEKENLENRIENEIQELQIVEGEKLFVSGIHYSFARLDNGVLISKIRGGGMREWRIFDANENRYSSIDSKGTEVFATLIKISKVEKKSVDKKPAYVNLGKKIEISELTEISDKKISANNRNYRVYVCAGNYYTIQGKGAAICEWETQDLVNFSRKDSKGSLVKGILIDTPKVERTSESKLVSQSKVERKSNFNPSYWWINEAKLFRV